IHLVAGNRGRSQASWNCGNGAIRRKKTVHAQLAAAGIGCTKTSQIDFAVSNGRVTVLGKIVASVSAGILLIVIKLGGYVVRVIRSQGAGNRTVIRVSAENRIGPDDPIGVAVGGN